MKVAVPRKSLMGLLRWSQVALFACAAAMLGYCGFVPVDTRVFQERESRNFQRLLEDQNAKSGDLPQAKAISPPKTLPAPEMSGLIGRIEIARLDLSVIVIEGDDGKTLRRAAGHVPGRPCRDNGATWVSPFIATHSFGHCEISSSTM